MFTEEENLTCYTARISNQMSDSNISALFSLYRRNKQEMELRVLIVQKKGKMEQISMKEVGLS